MNTLLIVFFVVITLYISYNINTLLKDLSNFRSWNAMNNQMLHEQTIQKLTEEIKKYNEAMNKLNNK